MDGTTVIKIDYYEELKAKADKQDAKKFLKENAPSIHGGFDRYRCPVCNNIITFDRRYDKFCSECGQRLDWTDL